MPRHPDACVTHGAYRGGVLGALKIGLTGWKNRQPVCGADGNIGGLLRKAKNMRSPESFEKEKIDKFLKSLDQCWFFKPYMKGFGKNGVPDILGCYRGRLFGMEVKREGAKPTPIQIRRMKEIEAAGGWTVAGTAEVVIDAFKRAFGG